MNRNRTFALAGIIGPVLFTGTFTIEGLLRPDYHPLALYISALSLGERGWIQITNFIVFGTLFLMFNRILSRGFPTKEFPQKLPKKSQERKASKSVPIIFNIIAISFIISGPFVMDPMGTARNQMSIHGTIHGIFGGIVFSLMPVSCFVFLKSIGNDPYWQTFKSWTLMAGIFISIAVVFFTITTKFPDASIYFKNWLGLIQRAALVPFMIWLFTIAVGFYKRT